MNNRNLVYGLGIGLLAGGALSIALSSGKRKRRKCKHQTIKAAGKVVDNVTGMFGL